MITISEWIVTGTFKACATRNAHSNIKQVHTIFMCTVQWAHATCIWRCLDHMNGASLMKTHNLILLKPYLSVSIQYNNNMCIVASEFVHWSIVSKVMCAMTTTTTTTACSRTMCNLKRQTYSLILNCVLLIGQLQVNQGIQFEMYTHHHWIATTMHTKQAKQCSVEIAVVVLTCKCKCMWEHMCNVHLILVVGAGGDCLLNCSPQKFTRATRNFLHF